MPILYYCSDGSRISQSNIERRYSAALRMKHEGNPKPVCECCGKVMAMDNAHVVAKQRCKELHKTELIYDTDNFVSACRNCHYHWDNWKSGEWIMFINVEYMLSFLKLHDHEGYVKRIELTKHHLQQNGKI